MQYKTLIIALFFFIYKNMSFGRKTHHLEFLQFLPVSILDVRENRLIVALSASFPIANNNNIPQHIPLFSLRLHMIGRKPKYKVFIKYCVFSQKISIFCYLSLVSTGLKRKWPANRSNCTLRSQIR